MHRWSGHIAALLAGPLLVLAAGGCSSEHESSAIAPFGTDNVVSVPATVSPGTAATVDAITVNRVAVIGDSITDGSAEALQQAFAGLGLTDVEINAETGRRMLKSGSSSSGIDGIEEVLATGAPPDLWVIALGTNDVANYTSAEYASAINQLLAALPQGARVVWVDCYLDAYQTASRDFDVVLRQVLAERGNATVVDWASIAAEDGVLRDGIHPSGFGREEFARRVAEAVNDAMT
jgi:lysophospholipase L1-like esterase